MRRFITALAMVAAVGAVAAPVAAAGGGNGAPSGPHFNLNIHGVANGQGFNGNNQNDIFVPLNGRCTINLVQSVTYDFQVLQPDCVNNPPASFSLPSPCVSTSGGLCTGTTTYYSVYARALGKPGGSSATTPCFTDTTGTTYCSLNNYVAVRGTGKSKFTNETSNLLFVTYCSSTGQVTTVPIFSNPLYQYFWNYDNTGLRLAQLRFYQVPSPLPTQGPTGTC